MQDTEKVKNDKERILSTIRLKGPCLPVQIARALNLEPILASALLSELKSEQKIFLSDMKVGSSPLYFSQGQEKQLENFISHLNNREKEALTLLKQSEILNDEEQSPIIRVALRAIKDFAIPLRIRIKEESKLFWKYFLLPDEKVKPLIQQLFTPEKTSRVQEKPHELKKEESKPPPPKTITKQVQITETQKPASPAPKKVPLKKTKPEYEFSSLIKSHLKTKDIELLKTISEKKREFISIVRVDTLFGKQEFYLIAKDKKKINENDITLALQKAQAEKMPSLLLSPGELDKKASENLQQWANLIKFEKMKPVSRTS